MFRTPTVIVLLAALPPLLAGCGHRAAAPAAAPGDVAAGRAVFQDNCAACHGEQGRGDGPGADALSPKPRDLSDPGVQARLTDDRVALVVKGGGKAAGLSDGMPAFGGVLSEEQVRQVTAFVRSLKRP